MLVDQLYKFQASIYIHYWETEKTRFEYVHPISHDRKWILQKYLNLL